MQAGRGCTFGTVLRARRRVGREPLVDALTGRTIHGHTLLWGGAHDRLAWARGIRCQSEASATAFAADGTGSSIPQASAVVSGGWPSDLSLPSPRSYNHQDESGLEQRHYLHSTASRAHLPGSDHGLVQPLRPGLGSIAYDGIEVLPRDPGLGLAASAARDFRFGPGSTVYECGIHGLPDEARDSDQHGRARPGPGQRFVERLWRTVKYEEVYLKDYLRVREAIDGLSCFVDFYNRRRLHQSLGYRTPEAVYRGMP